MIIRKPYAFLIKNFKKIHIFLFLLCGYILYKTTQLSSFVNEFLDLGTYDAYTEPVSRYITFLAYISLILIVASAVTILILLRKKDKPWKMYLIPIITYTGLLITFIMTSNFFATYTGAVETTGIRAIRDIIFILTIPQYVTFIILLIRILGLDLNKFDFKSDEEFLELSESDRDEMEININIDKASFKRLIRRLKRNAGYFYKEHKKMVYALISVITIIIIYQSYIFIFVTNKAYKEGDIINTNGYEIKINNSYYSNKNYKGEQISKESGFVILDVTIKNNAEKRKINFARFHVMNKTSNYSPTAKTYETLFQDLGTAYEEKTIDNNEEFRTLLIYKVKSQELVKNFVLYYQEFNDSNSSHLRKIKLNLQDMSDIKENDPLELYENLNFNIGEEEKEIIFDSYEILDQVSYNKENCNSVRCYYDSLTIAAKDGYKILKLSFASNEFNGKELLSFLSKYAIISYTNNEDKKNGIEIINSLPTEQYYGKYVYLKVPAEVFDAKSIELIITVRNNRYYYKIR